MKVIKLIGVLLLIVFLSLYFSNYNSYGENNNVLDNDAIERFEKDLKSGKDIDINNYKKHEKNYNNKATITTLKISKFIDNCVNRGMRMVVGYLENN